VIGAYVLGRLADPRGKPGFFVLLVCMFTSLVVIYACGVAQLMYVAKLSLRKALIVGVLPPLPGDAVKMVVAALICIKVRDRLKLVKGPGRR
jgi:biotin transport system substrate-specific component